MHALSDAARYFDLKRDFCGSNDDTVASCDWDGLQQHYERVGRSSRCKQTGQIRCCTRAHRCRQIGLNILNLATGRVPFNMCRNLEWLVCAGQGRLPGQSGPNIRFAPAPKQLEPSPLKGSRPLGHCGGWHPTAPPDGGYYGYANDDIYFLEVCLLSYLCKNGAEVFKVQSVEDVFTCVFSFTRLAELESLLRAPPTPRPEGAMRCTHSTDPRGNATKPDTRKPSSLARKPPSNFSVASRVGSPTIKRTAIGGATQTHRTKMPSCGDDCIPGCLCD